MLWKYKGQTTHGEPIEGFVEAENKVDAIGEIRKRQHFPTTVKLAFWWNAWSSIRSKAITPAIIFAVVMLLVVAAYLIIGWMK